MAVESDARASRDRSVVTPTRRRWPRRSGLASNLLCLGITLTSCTRVSDTQRFPPVETRLTIARTVPEQDAVIPADAQIDFCFSGTIDPRALGDLDAQLHSGDNNFDAQTELQLFSWRPPGAASGSSLSAWCPGSVVSLRPRSRLRPGVLYRVSLKPSAVGWAGEQLDVTTPGWVETASGVAFFLEFTVDPAAPPDEEIAPAIPPLRLFQLFAPGQVFALDNPACDCHREPDSLAIDRLNLSTPTTAFADLVLPTQLQSTDFPMVSPRRPAESYLIHTLLRDDEDEALRGVLGEPMPPDAPLAHAHMIALVRWIEDGALP